VEKSDHRKRFVHNSKNIMISFVTITICLCLLLQLVDSFNLHQLPVVQVNKIEHCPPTLRNLDTCMRNSMSDNQEVEKKLHHPRKKIVIAGAGVIGTSSAYYLTKNHPELISSLTLVDPTGIIAPAASGKAGGFLALNWNDHAPTGRLARRSFELHQDLAEQLGSDKIMYRRLTCASVSVRSSRDMRRPSGKKLEGVEWVNDGSVDAGDANNVIGYRPLGDESTIAQVHPKMLCEEMWDAVQSQANLEPTLIRGQVDEAVYSNKEGEEKKLIGAKLVDGTIIDADVVLFACGPWTQYGKCMLGVKYHSAIIPTRPKVLNQSVFFDGCGDPEVYPRPDGTAYCTGFPDPAIRVVEKPGEEEVREEAIEKISRAVKEASGGMEGALGNEPELKQSCYLPTTPDGLPMMGELQDKKGCFVAAGHGCWGILLGPGTGETMASLIATGSSTSFVNLSPFRPERFSNTQMW